MYADDEELKQETPAENEDVRNSAACDEAEEQDTAAKDNEWKDAENVPEDKKPAEPEVDELTKARNEAAAWKNKYVYLQAEYQNFRKRTAKDLGDVRIHTIADTLHPFLTVYDYLNMADNAAVKSDNVESIRQGLKMIIGQYNKALEELGVTAMTVEGAKFDPAKHEAMGNEVSDTVPEGSIIRQWSSGFMLGSNLLRPARVVVSSGPAKPAEPEAEKPADDAASQEK